MLWFVCCYSNPCGYSSRKRLYLEFERHILEDLGGNLLTVECAYGGKDLELVENENKNHMYIGVRARTCMWHKENLLNIGISRLPDQCTMIAWCDTDIRFASGATVIDDIKDALDKHPVVQCFSTCIDEGPDGKATRVHHAIAMGLQCKNTKHEKYDHPGYAWAARRNFVDRIGGLLDVCAVGGGDRMMAMAFVGRANQLLEYVGYSIGYVDHVLDWEERVYRYTGGNVGCVPGLIFHGFHGYKHDRGYKERKKILVDHSYSPEYDLETNKDGVYEVINTELAKDIYAYFESRNEDAR